MRLRIYIAINLALISLATNACGWFPKSSGNVWLYRIMPLDESIYEVYSSQAGRDYALHPGLDYSKENLLLWQKQTSSSVSLKDIERVVYHWDVSLLRNCSSSAGDNSFMNWIVRNGRDDIVQLLIMAKQNESITFHMADPWYYRVEDDENFQILEGIVEECYRHQSGTFVGRYALQAMRALCNLRKYDECTRYWDSVKNAIPKNVIRDMCELKAAAALYKTGRTTEALNIYAKYGDIASIRAINNGSIDNELLYVYDHCPNSPYIEGEIQKYLLYYGEESSTPTWFEDEFLDDILAVAHKAIREKKSKQMAMWYYTLAALYDVKGQPNKAKSYLCQGMKYRKFSFLSDSYRVLKMWLDAQTLPCDSSYEAQLATDLRWLVAKVERNRTSNFEKTMMNPQEPPRNSLSGFPEDLYSGYYQDNSNTYYWNDALRRLLLRAVCPKMHKAGKFIREIQLANLAENLLIQVNEYSNEMFLIMDRLPYRVTRDYFTRIYYPADDFDRFLNSKGKVDKNYWYDILATKCLRERRYSKALVYLKQIPVSFQRKMNVYPYMDRDPFSYDMLTFKKNSSLKDNYKLHFAQKMAEYKRVMNHDSDADKRADAKIQYALGLRNSVHKCWFLTRYSSNMECDYIREAIPDIPYAEDSLVYRHNEYLALSDHLIDQAIEIYRDKNKAAAQLKKLLYFKRIIDEFPTTLTALEVRQHCDRWRDYANNK